MTTEQKPTRNNNAVIEGTICHVGEVYRDSEERSVDEDGIYTCVDETACSAAIAAKESAK